MELNIPTGLAETKCQLIDSIARACSGFIWYLSFLLEWRCHCKINRYEFVPFLSAQFDTKLYTLDLLKVHGFCCNLKMNKSELIAIKLLVWTVLYNHILMSKRLYSDLSLYDCTVQSQKTHATDCQPQHPPRSVTAWSVARRSLSFGLIMYYLWKHMKRTKQSNTPIPLQQECTTNPQCRPLFPNRKGS